jgi:2-polyprenyl-3-methyl-5-hydroxy-6-metoxy-1,4-benzoquinol methylase
MSETSIVERGTAHFGSMAGDWWGPDAASTMLHRLNPVRLTLLRERFDHHWALDERVMRPLAGRQQGHRFHAMRRLHSSGDVRLNYLVAAAKPAAA